MKRLAALVFAGWMRLAELLEKLLLVKLAGTLVYILLLGPTALFACLTRKGGLDRCPDLRTSYWTPRAPLETAIQHLEKQY